MSVTIYEHRNGESELPTIVGSYWFDGVCTDRDGPDGEIKEFVFVTLVPEGAAWAGYRVEIPVQVDYDKCEHNARLDSLSGRWWGPVFAPWEQEGQSDD